MQRYRLIQACVLGATLFTARPADAQLQSTGTFSSVGRMLDALLAPTVNPNVDPNILLSQPEFVQRARDSREGIAIGIGNALASFPLGASSAGFAYVLDPATGAPLLKSVSFGPMFVERAVTNGRGVLNLGVSYQQASFDTLQNLDMKQEGFPIQSFLGYYLLDGKVVGDAYRVTLDVSSKMFLFSGSYGLTEKLDLGWAVPVASLRTVGRVMRDYDAARDFEAFPQVQPLYPGRAGTLAQFEGTADVSGIGDIVLRSKYAFGPPARQAGMIAGELRLPTGDEENLLGSGKTSFRLLGGGSKRWGVGSVNVNGGYTWGGFSEEINFAAGTEVALLARKQLTVTFDFISQTLRDTVTSAETFVAQEFFSIGPVELSRRVELRYGFWNRGTTTLNRAAVGGKYSLGRNWLLTASGLFRLNDNGYQPKFSGAIGIEHTWVRR